MSNALTLTAPQGLPFIDTVRDVDAPAGAVFRAHTDPALVAQWLGPHGYEMAVDHYDVRPGGSYRYVHRDPSGAEFAFHGCFHAVDRDAAIVQTFEFEGAPGHVSLERLTLEDLDGGRTRLRVHAVYQSVEARDAMVSSGMERGMRDGYERLDSLLAE